MGEVAAVKHDIALPDSFLEAGRDYYVGLKRLGLHPEGLLWGYDLKLKRFLMVMIWSGLEKYGPLALQERLFAAYRNSALPKTVNPLDVLVFSPNHFVGRALVSIPQEASYGVVSPPDVRITGDLETDRRHGQLEVRREWMYHLQPTKRPTLSVSQDWKRFDRNLSHFAA